MHPCECGRAPGRLASPLPSGRVRFEVTSAGYRRLGGSQTKIILSGYPQGSRSEEGGDAFPRVPPPPEEAEQS